MSEDNPQPIDPFSGILSDDEEREMQAQLIRSSVAKQAKLKSDRMEAIAPIYNLFHSAGFQDTFANIRDLPRSLDVDDELGTLIQALRQTAGIVSNAATSYTSLSLDAAQT